MATMLTLPAGVPTAGLHHYARTLPVPGTGRPRALRRRWGLTAGTFGLGELTVVLVVPL